MPQSQSSGSRSSGSIGRHLVFGGVGLFTGLSLGRDEWAAFSGACLGFLFSLWNSSREDLRELKESISAIEARGSNHSRPTSDGFRADAAASLELESESALRDDGRTRVVREAATLIESVPPESAPPRDAQTGPAPSAPLSAAVASAARPLPSAPLRDRPSAGLSGVDRVVAMIRSFLFGGNTIVRTGLLVLLVGLTLLAKYAAEHSLFPIEARLAGAALVGLALVVVGFRLRLSRPGFGMSLQGGGIAALYVVTFFAFKFYSLLPAGLAFSFFVGLAIATVILATLQSSEALLVIGSLGGFLAPILASTGEGNHVALFSYYLLLNISIAFVAWRKTWRLPALVGFVCTYGVAATWGVLRYEPENFASTEPFVLAFMFLFTAIAVLHAWRKPPHLRGLVDGTLVFGTPFVSILLQSALVRDRELGLALSAAGFGLFYVAWAVLVWRAGPRAIRPLAEAFIALAVGFATMAIPFAFDEALTTSIAWALEGGGLYWVGARQSRTFPRIAGFALQILAGVAFVVSAGLDQVDSSAFVPIANGRALSCLALAMAGLFIARRAYVSADVLRPVERVFAQLLGIWGLLWWTGGSVAEIVDFVPRDLRPSAYLVWIAATAIGLEWVARRSGWEPGRALALLSLPATALLLLPILDDVPHLLANAGWLAWPLVFTSFLLLWKRMGEDFDRFLLPFRIGSLWLLAVVSALALSGLAEDGFGLARDWAVAGFGVGIAVVLWFSSTFFDGHWSPFDRESESALEKGLGPIAIFALLTILGFQLVARGDASPLPHIPILNPVDLIAWLLLLSVWRWWRVFQASDADPIDLDQRRAAIVSLLAIGFVSLNGVLVRAVHQWSDIAFDFDALWASSAMQVTLSIAWTLTGMLGMLLASRRGWRSAWMGFAGLMAVVVLKLFTVDLSQLSTLTRIGTFLAVGALLLVLGYVSPVPPARDDEERPDPPPPIGEEP
jgi:uncharacterized membrane protein